MADEKIIKCNKCGKEYSKPNILFQCDEFGCDDYSCYPCGVICNFENKSLPNTFCHKHASKCI